MMRQMSTVTGTPFEVSQAPIAEQPANQIDWALKGALQTDEMPAHQNLYTDETVYEACREAVDIENPKKRIDILQALMADVVEQELHGSVSEVFQYLHEDTELLGPDYYEEHTSQAWRDVAYNGLVAVLASVQGENSQGYITTAHDVIKKHATHGDELSMGARLQAVHTAIEQHVQTDVFGQNAEVEDEFLKNVVEAAKLSRQAKAELYALTEGTIRRHGWQVNPLWFLYERIKDDKTEVFDRTMMYSCYQEAKSAIDNRDNESSQISYVWTPADAAATMRAIRMQEKAPIGLGAGNVETG